LLFGPVFVPSVSDSCSYPSCRLCLPLCASFPVVKHLLAVRGAAASPPLAHALGCPGTGRDSIDGLRGCQATMPLSR
jgi:hypothetical protein